MPIFTFFAVDKGNMTLIQFSNGINMMVDCRCSAERLSPGEYLREKIQKLDIVVVTHPHQDHLTGFQDVRILSTQASLALRQILPARSNF